MVQLVAPESPTIQMKKVVSTITTEEDVPKDFSLWSIINVTCNDTHYWKVWIQAAGESTGSIVETMITIYVENHGDTQ